MLKVVQAEVVKDGKVLRPATYEFDVVNKMQVTAAMVDQQIARLTADLARWSEIKAAMNPVVDDSGAQTQIAG